MKSIKIILPAALTFALFMGTNSMNAQSSFEGLSTSPIVSIAKANKTTKPIGLDYKQTLIQINEVLTIGIKADHTINYRGKVMVNLQLDASGSVQHVSFDKELPIKLKDTIIESLKSATLSPVSLNGKAKAQAFSIPVRIK